MCLTLLLETVSLLPIFGPIRVHAATVSQNNIVARANYMYDSTWVCQKTVTGWKGSYTFREGTTYHIPYGQPVYAGAYVGFGVSVDDYLAAAAKASVCMREYESKNKAFLNEQAGIIASQLEEGVPCPVCGSVEHPHPAALSPNAATEAEVKKAKKDFLSGLGCVILIT